jgi:23S rRNA (adenine2503-C2)-methyltransferase
MPAAVTASLHAAGLTEAERDRVLAKSALFNPPPLVLADGRRDLVGLSREELAAELAAIGEPAFRARQIWHWIYHRGATDFEAMSTVAKPLRARLAERFVVGRPETALVQTAADQTRKFLFRYRDGQQAETVYIPDPVQDRGALCISSQVGLAGSAIPARRHWCVIWARRKSSVSSWPRVIRMASGRARWAKRRGC